MDSTIVAAWIQAIVAVVVVLLAAGLAWISHKIDQLDTHRREDVRQLHERMNGMMELWHQLMRDHERENREFREDIKGRLGRLEALANGKE